MGSQFLEMSQYAQVLFVNVLKSYPAGEDVDVKYTVTGQLRPTSADWVGVFKIGWTAAATDAVHRVPVSLPEKYEPGQPANCVAVFGGSSLPKDPEEFYQFCYINSLGHVRGASTPFQFRHASTDEDDFVEEDLEDMLIVTSRSSVLDEKLDVAKEKIKVLNEEKLELVKDRQNLMLELSQAKKRIEETRQRIEQLEAELESSRVERLSETAEAREESDRLKKERDDLIAALSTIKQQEKEALSLVASLRARMAELRAEAKRGVAEAMSRSTELATVHEQYRAELTRIEAQRDQALVALQSERSRFVELEQSLACCEAKAAEDQKQQEERLCSKFDEVIKTSNSKVSELTSQLQMVQSDCQLLRQALAESESKIKELISHNASLVEETGREQAEAKEAARLLHEELDALKARLAESEKERLNGSLTQQQQTDENGDRGFNMDSYHALHSAYCDIKSMLKERTRERDAAACREKTCRATNSELTLTNRNLSAQLAAAEQRLHSLSTDESAAKQRLAPVGSGTSLTKVTADAGRPSATSSVTEPRDATVEQLREQMAASDEYYMTTLQQLQKDLQHERDARRNAELLLQRVTARIGCGSRSSISVGGAAELLDVAVAPPALGEKTREAGSGRLTSTTDSTDPRETGMVPRGAFIQAAADASPGLFVGLPPSSRLQRCPSDEDGQHIRFPPDDPFLSCSPLLLTTGRRPSPASTAARAHVEQSPSPSAPPPPTACAAATSGARSPAASAGATSVSHETAPGLVPFAPSRPAQSRTSLADNNGFSSPSHRSPQTQTATKYCPMCGISFEPYQNIDERTKHVNGHFA